MHGAMSPLPAGAEGGAFSVMAPELFLKPEAAVSLLHLREWRQALISSSSIDVHPHEVGDVSHLPSGSSGVGEICDILKLSLSFYCTCHRK